MLARVLVTSMPACSHTSPCLHLLLIQGFACPGFLHLHVRIDRISRLTLCHAAPNSTVHLPAPSPLNSHWAAQRKKMRSSQLSKILCPNQGERLLQRLCRALWRSVWVQRALGALVNPTQKSMLQTYQHQQLRIVN